MEIIPLPYKNRPSIHYYTAQSNMQILLYIQKIKRVTAGLVNTKYGDKQIVFSTLTQS
jgi:hypothetical protein